MTCLTEKTVQGFKDLFFRDFPYLAVWDNTETYNTGNEVYYETTKLFYRALNDGVTSTPDTVADWEKYEDDTENYILDADITKAFMEAQMSFNESIAPNTQGGCDEILHTFYYLTAHYLVKDIQASQKGVNSNGEYAIQSKSAGNVSVSYDIPEIYKNNPMLNFYTTTAYGVKYLNLVYPQTVGNVFAVNGATQP